MRRASAAAILKAMACLPLLAALAILVASSQDRDRSEDAGARVSAGGQVAPMPHKAVPPPTHGAKPVTPPEHPARPIAAPARPAPAPANSPRPPPGAVVPAPPVSRFHGAYLLGWVPVRVFQGVDELQLRGPGAITKVEKPDPVDAEVVGNWRMVLPLIAAAEDGYGRVDTVRETEDLGALIIRASGDFEWDVPGRLRTSGTLTEVVAQDAGADEHFWSFEGNGHTLVIAPGSNGELLLYDADNNAFFARATR